MSFVEEMSYFNLQMVSQRSWVTPLSFSAKTVLEIHLHLNVMDVVGLVVAAPLLGLSPGPCDDSADTGKDEDDDDAPPQDV